MHTPLIRYLVSSPYGDIPMDNDKWDLPLEGDLLKTPYRVYFQSIKNFLVSGAYTQLLSAAKENLGREILSEEISEIIIRTEKHGALYHPASIEVILKQGRVNPVRKGRALNEAGLSNGVKFGLNVAVSEAGRKWLKKEFSVIQRINTKFKMPYLPKVYFFDEQDTMSFLLEEWFEGYHEFHLSKTESGVQLIKLWEFGKGYTYLSSEQSFEIYRQASKILTLYYDMNDFSQIYPWHHAAGDFVVRIHENISPSPNPSHQGRGNKRDISRQEKSDKRDVSCQGREHSFLIPSPLVAMARRGEGEGEGYFQDKIDVRLTTVRGYEPFMGFNDDDMVNPALALFYFLLHLSIQMRLDKLDGTGDIVWADDICVDATLAGFFQGIELKKDFKDCCGSTITFLKLLQSFSKDDLMKVFKPLVGQFDQTRDFHAIEKNLEDHISRFYLILQNFPS